jgi:branched-chain amino acid aminotransferase
MNISQLTAWKNGNFCPLADLNVSILDLGLIHSDATYDVLSIHQGRALMLSQHLDRLWNSCQGWRLPMEYSQEHITQVISQMYQNSGLTDALCWIAITRGVPLSGNPRDLPNCVTNVMMYVKPYYGFNPNNSCRVGLASNARVPDWAINQQYKNWAWQDLTQAQWQALDRGFDTAVLLDQHGYLTEGPGFNVGIIVNDTVLAPRVNRLPGITMQLVSELCYANQIKFEWCDIDLDTLKSCTDMFITSSAGHIIPVIEFESRVFQPSNCQAQLQQLMSIALTLDQYTTLL